MEEKFKMPKEHHLKHIYWANHLRSAGFRTWSSQLISTRRLSATLCTSRTAIILCQYRPRLLIYFFLIGFEVILNTLACHLHQSVLWILQTPILSILLAQTGRMQDWGLREKMPMHAGVPKAKAPGMCRTGVKVYRKVKGANMGARSWGDSQDA